MWNPQFTYPHGGGVYAHAGIPMGSQPQVQKGPPLTTVIKHDSYRMTPLNMDTPTKSTGSTENGLMKKLKEFDELAMSLGNGDPPENERKTLTEQLRNRWFN
ncbi:G-box-binding factor 3 [Raphanus sativus]|nr:G-box-binding factor 3 [Raphanus sativus]